MRAAVPVLISSLVFASLISDCLGMANRNSTLSPSSSHNMLSFKSKPKRNEPEKPIPHRGTGRRSLIESSNNAHITV
ncbi:heterocyst-inhibiting protein PatX [Anabaena subtropica]